MTSDRPAVLIVDDNPDKLVALESILLELNVDIVKATSGQEALRRLLTDDFAVVLLDVRMPTMDGFETAALIRQRTRTARTPIIFVTAFGDETHVARGYSLRAVDYLLAPIVPEVLRTKVSVLVDLYRSTVEVRRQAERLHQQAAQLRRLSTASLQLHSAPSIEAILQHTADHARAILAAERALVRAEVEKHPALRAVSGTDRSEAEADGAELALLESACATHRPQRAAAGLAVPFCGRDGRSFGALAIRISTDGLTQEDEDVVVQLAHMTAVAVENALHREAREADRLKDEFLATVSHELRTPLSAMLSWAWMLRRGKLDAGAEARAIEAIERNAQAQARLVDDLLDVSRIITGKLKLTPRLVDLGAVVATAVDSVGPAAQAKGVTLARLVDAEAGAVLGDLDRLHQVVANLLSNAIKFTPRGGLVDVRLERDGREVTVSVRDTGVGIASEFLPHVFERFRQADASSTRTAGGLGLGLAIVHHLVEMHGGRVEAQSDGPGCGSTFVVRLARAEGRAPERAASEPAAATAVANGQTTLAGVRVLVVEDELDARDALAMMIGGAGADVAVAGSVAEALEVMAHWRPELLVCDIGLPGEDGYALIAKIRASEPAAGGTVPAVALTAYARASDRARALAAGFQAHLAKPFEPRRLLDLLARVVSRSRANRPAAATASGCAGRSA